MNWITKQLNAFLKEWQGLRKDIAAIPDVIKDQTNAIREFKNADDKHRDQSPSLTRTEMSTPVPIRVEAETTERYTVWDKIKWAAEILGIAAAIILAFLAYFQWREMVKATKASTDASRTAACALEENKRQFQDTLREMRNQTRFQQMAASASLTGVRTAKNQFDVMVEQSSPHLLTPNVDFTRDKDGMLTGVKFDLFNGGGSVATVQEESDAGAVPYSQEKDLAAIISQKINVNPITFPLDKGISKPFEVPMTDWITIRNTGQDSYAWRRFTYNNITGKSESLCLLFIGSKHGIRALRCDPQLPAPKPPKQ